MTRRGDDRGSWEDLAGLDPKWAILTDPTKKSGGWGDDEFFATGRADVGVFLDRVGGAGRSVPRSEALDFGCGLGRLTAALAEHVPHVVGIDISTEMIRQATTIHRENERVEFIHNVRPDLGLFDDGRFGLVYSVLVLQHIPSVDLIRSLLREFLRVLQAGGMLYVQLPSVPAYSRSRQAVLAVRSALYRTLTTLGVSRSFCFERLHLVPMMHMSHLSAAEVGEIVGSECDVLGVWDPESTTTTYLMQKR